jgi:DNA-binding HxlR family transcriptional regulator
VLASPLNVDVLRVLEREPRPLIDLRRAVGGPPQTTLRGHLKALTDLGALERRRRSEFPGAVDFALGAAGRELLEVGHVLGAWLELSPEGPIELGTPAAKSAIKALLGGWSSAMIRALAAGPLSLTQLDRLIPSLNYPSLERRLAALRLAGQIEALSGSSRGTPYAASPWLRRSIAPLASAARWERRLAPPRSAPIGRLDVESAFLLTVPFLSLPAKASGAVRLAVEVPVAGEQRGHAGVRAEIDAGRVVSCVTRLQGPARGWISGKAEAWIAAVVEHESAGLEIGGDSALARAILDGLNGALFSTANSNGGHSTRVPDS